MEKIILKNFSDYLKKRPTDAHKGDFGHVLIIGGTPGFSGAVLLAAKAALRVGAGLVSIATHPEHAHALNVFHPEIMCHGIETIDQLSLLLERASVIVLGPGLGLTAWSQMLFKHTLLLDKDIIVDADGLNLLANHFVKKTNWILTPHPGEASRLLKSTREEIQKDRLQAVISLQEEYGGSIVLKGAGTLVADESKTVEICEAGNPGMASAGMGDVLSGVIGALVAQHVPLSIAAKLGVVLHAKAGDLAAKKGQRGMIASDLIPFLRELVN